MFTGNDIQRRCRKLVDPWRLASATQRGGIQHLAPVRRGPKAAEPNPLAAEVAHLQKSNADLTRCLARAKAIAALMPASGLTAAICASFGAFAGDPLKKTCAVERATGNRHSKTASVPCTERSATPTNAGCAARAALRRSATRRNLCHLAGRRPRPGLDSHHGSDPR